jgi:uncharacterized membrane protein
VIYTIPYQYAGDGTTVAINVGGAILPLLIVGYALSRAPAAFLPSALGTVAVAGSTRPITRKYIFPWGRWAYPWLVQ